MAEAYIGIGSNLGPREQHIALAFDAAAALPDTRVCATSPIYETDPVGPPGQGPYLNAAMHLTTDLSPRDVLSALRRIEEQAGRERRERWGPRTLDLDILLYDDQIIDGPQLTVPHPCMHERWFVLKPLCDIAPDAVHPKRKQTVHEMLDELERADPNAPRR